MACVSLRRTNERNANATLCPKCFYIYSQKAEWLLALVLDSHNRSCACLWQDLPNSMLKASDIIIYHWLLISRIILAH